MQAHVGHHAQVVFVQVDAGGVVHAAPLEFIHHVGVHAVGIDGALVQRVWIVGTDGHQSVRQAFQLEVAAQADVRIVAGGHRKVDGTFPVVGADQVQQHHRVLGDVTVGDLPTDFGNNLVCVFEVHRTGLHNARRINRNAQAVGGEAVDLLGLAFDVVFVVEGVFQHFVDRYKLAFVLLLGVDVDHIARALAVLLLRDAERHRVRVVGFALHLIDVPIGVEQREVDHAHICAVAFDLLHVPEREGVVVSIGEQDGVGLQRVQVVLGKVHTGATLGAVVVVPAFGGHDHRHNQTEDGSQQCTVRVLKLARPKTEDSQGGTGYNGHVQQGVAECVIW